MIFVKDKSNKYHIAELTFRLDEVYCVGCLYDWVPVSGRAYLRKEQLPEHIKLCGLCLKRYNEMFKSES